MPARAASLRRLTENRCARIHHDRKTLPPTPHPKQMELCRLGLTMNDGVSPDERAERLEIGSRAFQWKIRTDTSTMSFAAAICSIVSEGIVPCAPDYFCLVDLESDAKLTQCDCVSKLFIVGRLYQAPYPERTVAFKEAPSNVLRVKTSLPILALICSFASARSRPRGHSQRRCGCGASARRDCASLLHFCGAR